MKTSDLGPNGVQPDFATLASKVSGSMPKYLTPPTAFPSVGDMDDVVPFVEIEERVDRPREALPRGPRRHVFAAKELGARDEDELLRHEAEAAGEVAAGEVEAAAAGRELSCGDVDM